MSTPKMPGAGLPASLRAEPRWVVWRYESVTNQKTGEIRRTKVPFLATNPTLKASSTDSGTWGTYSEAVAAVERGEADGAGFMLGDGWVGVDLDHCRDSDAGTVERWASTLVETLDTYTEISPSDEGLHLILRAVMPGDGRGRRCGALEVYGAGRFFTMTGKHLSGTSAIVEDHQAQLDKLMATYFAPKSRSRANQWRMRVSPSERVDIDDGELLALARERDTKFAALWGGDTNAYSDDVSRATAALCMKLAFWTGCDAERMDALFRQSGLMRDKWDSRRGTSTWGAREIAAAISLQTTSYAPQQSLLQRRAAQGRPNASVPAAVAPAVDLPDSEQATGDASAVPPLDDLYGEGAVAKEAYSYRATPNGLIRIMSARDGEEDTNSVRLTNFVARIVADVIEDDGAETRRTFTIKALRGVEMSEFNVPAESFAGMSWATEKLGAQAVIFPGLSAKEHARTAIQLLSRDIPRRIAFAHTGWRCLSSGGWVYLHACGAIGANGLVENVAVTLPPDLAGYELPEPPAGDMLRTALAASMRFLAVAPAATVWPLYALIWRAPLGESDFSGFASGPTGEGKTELAALAQQHYGAGMDARHLPASWLSSGNALEALAFIAKDALLVVDDYVPTGSTAGVQRQQRDAERVFRGKGNAAGRQRMRADTTLRPAKPPRALVLGTGEDVPLGHSLRSRLCIVEHAPRSLKWDVLSTCQRDARGGLYALAMAGYIRWLARRYDQVRRTMPTMVAELCSFAASTTHRRTAAIVAHLALGAGYFLAYAVESGALALADAELHWQAAWQVFGKMAKEQAEHQTASEPTARWLSLVVAALTAGKAHVAMKDSGKMPTQHPAAWGWKVQLGEVGDVGTPSGWPQGTKIGWLDGDDLFLQPEATHAVIRDLARGSTEPFLMGDKTLHTRLKQRGLLASTEPARQTNIIRKTCEGAEQKVLHLKAQTLYPSPTTDRTDNAAHSHETEPYDVSSDDRILSVPSGNFPTFHAWLRSHGFSTGERRVSSVSCADPSKDSAPQGTPVPNDVDQSIASELPSPDRGTDIASHAELTTGAQVANARSTADEEWADVEAKDGAA